MVLPPSKKNAPFTDIAACYGAGDLNTLVKKRYDLAFSLWLNRGRSIVRQAEIVRLGGVTALTGGQKLSWFDCLADTPEEARYLFDKHQAMMVKEQTK